MRPGDLFWTDETVESLKALWNEGKSATEIGMKLNVPAARKGRSAVLGKIHRLKQEGWVPTRPPTPPKVAKEPKPKGKPGRKKKDPNSAAEVSVLPAAKKPAASALETLFPGLADATCSGRPICVPYAERDIQQGCAWPTGDPGQGMTACNRDQDENRPYCAYHASLAYQSIGKRRRRKHSLEIQGESPTTGA